jgi:sulfofructose kinase
LAGRVTGLSDWAKAALALPGAGKRACTGVTVGDKGCYYVLAGEKQARYCSAYKVEVVETTGCGDVFHGAYAAALAQGKDVPACLQLASAAAAVYASRPSGWRYLATPADVAALPKQ